MSTLLLALLQLAEERVRITTAYFVPGEELIERLCVAGDRGVKVEILLPDLTPTSGSCNKRVSPSSNGCFGTASGSGDSARPCCTPRS